MRAVLELIERDAVMVAWLCRDPGRQLPLNLCDAETRDIASELMSAGASVAFYLLEGAGKIPVVLCTAMGDGRSWPGLSATAAAHPCLRHAARGAMLEQAVSGFGLMKMLREGSGPRPMRPEEVRCGQFIDHACYYLPKREEELAFLRNAPSYEPEVESHEGQFRALLNWRPVWPAMKSRSRWPTLPRPTWRAPPSMSSAPLRQVYSHSIAVSEWSFAEAGGFDIGGGRR